MYRTRDSARDFAHILSARFPSVSQTPVRGPDAAPLAPSGSAVGAAAPMHLAPALVGGPMPTPPEPAAVPLRVSSARCVLSLSPHVHAKFVDMLQTEARLVSLLAPGGGAGSGKKDPPLPFLGIVEPKREGERWRVSRLIISQIQMRIKIYRAEGDKNGATGAKRFLDWFTLLSRPVSTVEDLARAITAFNPAHTTKTSTIYEKATEVIQSGECKQVTSALRDPAMVLRIALMEFDGVGPRNAELMIQPPFAIKSVEDLKERLWARAEARRAFGAAAAAGGAALPALHAAMSAAESRVPNCINECFVLNQKDIEMKVSRAETEHWRDLVQDAANVAYAPKRVQIVVCGSYSRGAAESQDVDIMICPIVDRIFDDWGGEVEEATRALDISVIVAELERRGMILGTLRQSEDGSAARDSDDDDAGQAAGDEDDASRAGEQSKFGGGGAGGGSGKKRAFDDSLGRGSAAGADGGAAHSGGAAGKRKKESGVSAVSGRPFIERSIWMAEMHEETARSMWGRDIPPHPFSALLGTSSAAGPVDPPSSSALPTAASMQPSRRVTNAPAPPSAAVAAGGGGASSSSSSEVGRARGFPYRELHWLQRRNYDASATFQGMARLPPPAIDGSSSASSSSSSSSSGGGGGVVPPFLAARYVRRLDLKSVPRITFPYAHLSFTAATNFNRVMRHYANCCGWAFGETGLRPAMYERNAAGGYRVAEEGSAIYCSSEEDIFALMGLPFVPPCDRLAGRWIPSQPQLGQYRVCPV